MSVFLMICVVFSLSAQEDFMILNQEATKERISIGSFGGSIFLGTSFNNNFDLGIGGGGGITVNDFYIGIFGIGQSFDNSLVEITPEAQHVDIGYAGLWLGYSFYKNYRLHPFVSLRSGLGGLEVHNDENHTMLMRESMVVLTPEFGLEFNISDEFRVASTFGYRWLSTFDEQILPRDNYSGMTMNTSLRFVIE